MYRDDLWIVGVEPTPLIGAVLRYVFSEADATFIQNLGCFNLLVRSNTTNSKAALLNVEVTFRAKNLKKQHRNDNRAFETTLVYLEKKLVDLTTLLEKETANSKRREENMNLDFKPNF